MILPFIYNGAVDLKRIERKYLNYLCVFCGENHYWGQLNDENDILDTWQENKELFLYNAIIHDYTTR